MSDKLTAKIIKKIENARKKAFEKKLPKGKTFEDVVKEETQKLKKFFIFLEVCIKFIINTEKILHNKINEIEAKTKQKIYRDEFIKEMWVLQYTILYLMFFEIKPPKNTKELEENNKLISFVLKGVLEKENKSDYLEWLEKNFFDFTGVNNMEYDNIKNIGNTFGNLIAEKMPTVVFNATGGRLGGEQHDLIMELVMTTILKDKKFFYGDSNFKDDNILLTNDETNDIKQSIQESQSEREQTCKDFFESLDTDTK